MAKQVRRTLVGTYNNAAGLLNNYNVVKIEGAEVYWDDSTCTLGVVTSQGWKDYLLGKADSPFEREDN